MQKGAGHHRVCVDVSYDIGGLVGLFDGVSHAYCALFIHFYRDDNHYLGRMLQERIRHKLQERRAQILLPAVLLAPIFILVIYLLFETAKVSMYKVRHQFALDASAYAQMSSASTYLNAVAYVNGGLAHRNMYDYAEYTLDPAPSNTSGEKITIFDLFYKGGAFPAIGPDYETGLSPRPAPEATSWGLKYYTGDEVDGIGNSVEPSGDRTDWMKEDPKEPGDKDIIPIMSKQLTDMVFFSLVNKESPTVGALSNYIATYGYLGDIYDSQDYAYKDSVKNARFFREAYFLNSPDGCKRDECARQSAAQIAPFLNWATKPFRIANIRIYATEGVEGVPGEQFHARSYHHDFSMEELMNKKMFQFAYLPPETRNKLRMLSRGVLLKQSITLPQNRFNIHLEQKYKPYVRNRMVLSCPHNGNNCIWPDPIPKYSITLEP